MLASERGQRDGRASRVIALLVSVIVPPALGSLGGTNHRGRGRCSVGVRSKKGHDGRQLEPRYPVVRS